MNSPASGPRSLPRYHLTFAFLTVLLVLPTVGRGQNGKVEELKIGSTAGLSGDAQAKKEAAARDTLRDFIKEETGLANKISAQEDWREVAKMLAKGDLHLGVFQGHEFALAQALDPMLKPLAIAVNQNTYPVGHVLGKAGSAPMSVAGLKGKIVAIPAGSPRFLRTFLDKEAEGNAVKFFAKIVTPEGIEDAIEDVIEGKVDAVVVDRVAVDAYKAKRPARFKFLAPIAQSPKFPPPVVAYYEKTALTEKTLAQFRDGLLDAKNKAKGQTMLTLFRLSGFAEIPSDLDAVLKETRKKYPDAKP